MRAFADHLGIRRIVKRKKPGKPKKYVPISWAEWGSIIQAMHERVDKRITHLAPGQRKVQAQEFHYPLLQDLRGFKEAFRNQVTHGRRNYSQKKAGDVFEHVQRFMTLLSSKVSLPYQRYEDDEA